MPIGGGEENFCVFGAEPSSGGKAVVDMGGHASEVRGRAAGPSYARRVMESSVHDVGAVGARVHDGGAVATEVTETDSIAHDLDDVDAALKRLDAGTYFTDEVTGAPLDPAWLAEHPLARRASP